MAKDKNTLKRDTEKINRTFSYQKGACQLNFQLRIDIKQELKDFLECLVIAKKDVEEQIAKVGK